MSRHGGLGSTCDDPQIIAECDAACAQFGKFGCAWVRKSPDSRMDVGRTERDALLTVAGVARSLTAPGTALDGLVADQMRASLTVIDRFQTGKAHDRFLSNRPELPVAVYVAFLDLVTLIRAAKLVVEVDRDQIAYQLTDTALAAIDPILLSDAWAERYEAHVHPGTGTSHPVNHHDRAKESVHG